MSFKNEEKNLMKNIKNIIEQVKNNNYEDAIILIQTGICYLDYDDIISFFSFLSIEDLNLKNNVINTLSKHFNEQLNDTVLNIIAQHYETDAFNLAIDLTKGRFNFKKRLIFYILHDQNKESAESKINTLFSNIDNKDLKQYKEYLLTETFYRQDADHLFFKYIKDYEKPLNFMIMSINHKLKERVSYFIENNDNEHFKHKIDGALTQLVATNYQEKDNFIMNKILPYIKTNEIKSSYVICCQLNEHLILKTLHPLIYNEKKIIFKNGANALKKSIKYNSYECFDFLMNNLNRETILLAIEDLKIKNPKMKEQIDDFLFKSKINSTLEEEINKKENKRRKI